MNETWEYSFERVGSHHTSSPEEYSASYRQAIAAKGREGWRFVQALPLDIGPLGSITHAELIFERRKS